MSGTTVGLDRILIAVTDPGRSATFYQSLLGAPVLPVPMGAMNAYRADIAGVQLVFVPKDVVGISAHENIHQLRFRVLDIRACVDAALAVGGTLVDEACPPENACCLRDPDGNTVELIQDTP